VTSKGNGNGDPQLSWGTVISMVGVVAVLFGGSWAVFQTQFGYIEKDKEVIRQELVRSLTGIQSQFKSVSDDFDRRRLLNVEQVEFKQFEARYEKEVADIQQRLSLIEQTRPTTGELRGISENADKQINRILNRLDQLEAKK
jgi:hypothetical protein